MEQLRYLNFGEEYIEEGMILHLDGINNTRNGHSTTTTTWEDISGNNNDFTKLSGASNAIWSDNSYVGNETNKTLTLNKAILSSANECTVEVCYDVPEIKDYYWVFQSRQSTNPPNGFQIGVDSNCRFVDLFISNSIYNKISSFKNIKDINKKTMAFAVDNNNVIFSDNCQFYTEEAKEGIINSIIQRDVYSIGSTSPWGRIGNFKGNIFYKNI